MAFVMRYRIFSHATGEFLAEGTMKECAEKIGVEADTLRRKIKVEGNRRKYDFEPLTPHDTRVNEAIRNWDAFCEPLRKKYGIKVWNGGEDEAAGRNDSG